MTDKYPYFIYPDVIALRNPESGLSPEERERIIRKIAANVGDIPALRLMLGLDSEEFARFYPDMKASTPSTSDTIDTFLSRFGRQDAPVSKAAEEIGTDYTDKQFDDYNANSVNNVNNVNNDLNDLNVPTDTPPENLASANEYIKKRDYQTALEIIMRISLNNPEKSIYFADQIRFLKKLILNQTKKNNCGS